MRPTDIGLRALGTTAVAALAAWASIATVAWQHAQVECFWALRDLKDQRRDVDALTEEVSDLRARVRSATDWNRTLLECHKKAMDRMLEDAPERNAAAPVFHHFPCDRLDL